MQEKFFLINYKVFDRYKDMAYKTLLPHKTLLDIRSSFFGGPSDYLQLLTHKTIAWEVGGVVWWGDKSCDIKSCACI